VSAGALRRALARIHPFEWFTWGMTALIVLFLRAHHLRIDWRTVEHMAGPMFGGLPRAFFLGLFLQGIVLLAARRSPRLWLRRVATPASMLLWLRVWLAAMAMTYSYTWLKVCVPLLHQRIFDPLLWKLDRWLHFGISPSIFAAELVRGTPVAGWIDIWYALWLTTVLAALAGIFLSERPELRRNFALACTLTWLVGAWIYLAVPALGPCYAYSEIFDHLLDDMPRARGAQAMLWQNYGKMLAGRDGSLREFNPYFGVAALPSLHVGVHWLFALWARRYARPLYPLFLLATLFTFFGSLATGWHYAVDGYLGMLLAWGAVVVADRLEPVPPDGGAGAAPAERPSAPPPGEGEGDVRDEQPGDE
jgi:hypothetical protein